MSNEEIIQADIKSKLTPFTVVVMILHKGVKDGKIKIEDDILDSLSKEIDQCTENLDYLLDVFGNQPVDNKDY